ncbi:MAG: hypothetical protein QM679_00940 [Patulibacter sp.]
MADHPERRLGLPGARTVFHDQQTRSSAHFLSQQVDHGLLRCSRLSLANASENFTELCFGIFDLGQHPRFEVDAPCVLR